MTRKALKEAEKEEREVIVLSDDDDEDDEMEQGLKPFQNVTGDYEGIPVDTTTAEVSCKRVASRGVDLT